MKNAHLLLLSSCLACVGTETGNPPVIDFGNSGCHDQTYAIDKGDPRATSEPTDPDPRYRGLNCLIWERPDEDTLRIRVTNYATGCGADEGWRGLVEQHADSLDLVLQDDYCPSADCDNDCTYDLNFTIPQSASREDTLVRLYQRGCAESDRDLRQAVLALGSQPSGVVCDYASYHHISLSARLGRERDVCGPASGLPSNNCAEGLVCTNLGENEGPPANKGERCLRSCQTDADCDAMDRCVDAVCKLSGAGLTSG